MSESSAEAVVSEFRFGKFGLLLRKLRTEAGVSQDGLAERAGISAKTVGALEQGARRAAHDDTIHPQPSATLCFVQRSILAPVGPNGPMKRPKAMYRRR